MYSRAALPLFYMVLSVLVRVAHGSTMVFPGEAFDPLDTPRRCKRAPHCASWGAATAIMELDHPEFLLPCRVCARGSWRARPAR